MAQYKGLQNKRVLVVEDMELNQYLARHIMESWGCVVEIAENGAIAIDKINEADFDIVLMDIQMPVMDGMEATRQIRKMENSYKSSTPVVALTANAAVEYERYIQVGMNDCLAKPFQESSLYNTVSKNIRKEDRVSSLAAQPVAEAADQLIEEQHTPVKVYDLSMVEAISGGDKAFIVKMIRLFLDTVPATLNDLNKASQLGDWSALSKHAHKLKSTIDSMGIAEIKQDIRFIENNAKTSSHTEQLPSYVDRVVEVMNKVIRIVKKDFNL